MRLRLCEGLVEMTFFFCHSELVEESVISKDGFLHALRLVEMTYKKLSTINYQLSTILFTLYFLPASTWQILPSQHQGVA